MPRLTLPSESCCFRLDSDYGYRQQFPMTFNDVGLSDDGFEFNGESSYIRVPHQKSISFGINDSFTVSCSFIFDGNTDKALRLYRKGSNYYLFTTYTGEDVIFYTYDGTTTSGGRIDGIGDGHIHNVTVVVDRYNGKVLLYLDGIHDGTSWTLPDVGDTSSPYDLYIGSDGGDSLFFNGTIKHVSIYNRALTAQEVADRYNQSTFLFLNNTPTPTQQAYLDWQNSRIIGRSR